MAGGASAFVGLLPTDQKPPKNPKPKWVEGGERQRTKSETYIRLGQKRSRQQSPLYAGDTGVWGGLSDRGDFRTNRGAVKNNGPRSKKKHRREEKGN